MALKAVRHIRVTRGGRIRLVLHNRGAAPASGVVSMKHPRTGNVVRRPFGLKAGQRRKLTTRVSRAGRRILLHRGELPVVVTVRSAPPRRTARVKATLVTR